MSENPLRARHTLRAIADTQATAKRRRYISDACDGWLTRRNESIRRRDERYSWARLERNV